MKHKFLKLTALILALTMILPFALLGCSDAILNDTVQDALENKDSENGESTPAKKTEQAVVALDMTAEWEKLYGENTLVQGCLVINREFAAAHPNEVAKFLRDYEQSVNTIKKADTNAVNLVVNADILPQAPIAQKALPGSNLCYFAGNDMKPVMNPFCEKMLSLDAQSIGGKLPSDDFYYTENGNSDAADPNLEIKVYALNGTTALGMAEMIVASEENTDDMNYNISLYTAPDEILPAVQSGECQIAALPTNAAAKIFNKTGKVQLLALNTLGVLYLLQNEGYPAVSSLNGLKGKTIYVPGAGANPEYITVAILQGAGLVIGSDVMIDTTTYTSPDALATAFASGLIEFAVLPEPKVTVTLTQANAKK